MLPPPVFRPRRPAGCRGATRGTGSPHRLWRVGPLLGLTVVGLAVRLVIPRGLWSDEAISLTEAHMGFGTMIRYLRTEDIHPPLYFSVLWVDVRLFGYGELAVRVPSIAAGTLIIPMAYLAGRACLDRRAGYIAATLAAVAPLMVWYSQEARMYAFFMLFSLVGLWAAVRCLQDGGWRYWAALVLSAAALCYNEYFGLLQVGAEVSAIGALLLMRRRSEPGPMLVKRALAAAAGLALLTAPLLPYAYRSLARSAGHPLNGVAPATGGGGSGGSLSIYNLLALFNWALWGYHSNGVMSDLNAVWPALMLLVLLLLGRGLGAPTLLLAWCVTAPVALLFAAGLYQPNLFDIRYAAGVVPLLIVLAATLVARTTRTWTATTVATGLLVVLSVVALVDQQYDWGNPRLFDFEHTVSWITNRYQPGDVILYGPNGIGNVIQYYAGSVPAELAVSGAGRGARQVFLLIVPPLYGTDTTAEAVTIYEAGLGRKVIGRDRGANVDVWEFQ